MAAKKRTPPKGGSARGGRPPATKDGIPKEPLKASKSRLAPLSAEERFRRSYAGPRFVGFDIRDSTQPSREIEGDLRGMVALRPEREREGLAHNTAAALDAMETALWDALTRRLEVEYRESGNALYCWKAWALSREFARPLPAWAAEYLDGAAARLLACAAKPPPNLGRALARSLGFQVGRGRGSEFSAFQAFRRHVALADTVRASRERGATLEEALALAAARHGVGGTAAKAAWRELRALLPQRASFWARGARKRVGK